MRGIVDFGLGRRAHQVEDDEQAGAGPVSADDGARYVRLTAGQVGEERAEDTENRARSSYAVVSRVPEYAGQAGQDSRAEVEQQHGRVAVEALGQAADVPERPQVGNQVHEVEMHEQPGNQAPPLTGHGHLTEIGPPCNVELWLKPTELAGVNGHHREDKHVHGKYGRC